MTTLDLAERIAAAVLTRPGDGPAAVLEVMHETQSFFGQLGDDDGETTYRPLDGPQEGPAGEPALPSARPSGTPPDSVIAHAGPLPTCLQCHSKLPPPKHPNRPRRFCPGSRCRSMWHLEQRRQLIAAVHASLDNIATLVKGLK